MARGGAAKEAANDTGRTELKTVVDNRTVGEILSEARIARGMDYAGVAEQLRIRRTYIEAIEEGRLGDLPGSTYAIGFVRTYAELMDLDVPKIVTKFKREAADFEDRTQLVFPEPMPGSRGPTASVILIAILMLAGAYGGWLYVSNKDRDTIELVPPLPEALSKLLSQATIGETPDETVAAPAPAAEQPAPTAAPVADTASTGVVAEAETQPTIVNETIASAASALEATSETVQEAGTQAAAEVEAAVAETAEAVVEEVEETVAAVTDEASAVVATPEAQEAATATDQVETAPAAVAAEAADETGASNTVAETVAAAAPAATQEPIPSPTVSETLQSEAETALPQVSGTQPAAFGTEAGASRIVIRATSPSWVEITAADGTVLLNRLLRTGDTFRVPDQPGITLVTGSAGGLEFSVDGKVAPRIGEVGDVRRDVLLEPDALLKTQ